MARIRTIKPSFFKSDDVSALPLRARLTWVGLWTQCDDQGRTKDHLKLIKADVWPLDPVSLADIEEDLSTLAAHGRIVRYQVDGENYLAVTNWDKHQKINRPTASHIPPPAEPHNRANGPGPGTASNGLAPAEHYASEPRETVNEANTDASLSAHGRLSEDSRGEGKGREGKGRDARAREAAEPPRTCPEHQNQRNPPPCGACRTARERNEEWRAERRARLDAAPKCPHHRGQPAHNCGLCRAGRLGRPPPTAADYAARHGMRPPPVQADPQESP